MSDSAQPDPTSGSQSDVDVDAQVSFYKVFVPWMRWCALFFAAVLLTVLGVTALLWREPDSCRDLMAAHPQPLEVGAEERARERLRNSHAELIERLLLVFGPADRELVGRHRDGATHVCPPYHLNGEEPVLWDLIREAEALGAPAMPKALVVVADAVCRLLHVRRWFPHADAGFLADRMNVHAVLYEQVLPADLLIVVDLLGRSFVRINNAVIFYELRSVTLTGDALLLRLLRLLCKK